MSNPALKRKIESSDGDQPKKSKSSDGNTSPVSSKNGSDAQPPQESDPSGTATESFESEKASKQETSADVPATPSKPLKEKAEEVKTPKDDEKVAPSRPVFGAASTFGTSSFDKIKKKPSIFDSLPSQKSVLSQEPAKAATSSFGSFGSSFGANSSFGNALKRASEKKSFLDEPKDEESQGSATPEVASESAPQYKQVTLDQKKVTTGEEHEKSVFSSTAKLFELDLAKVADGWKERGLGPLHLNQSISNKTEVRLVMRSQGLLRVVLNYRITGDTLLMKGLQASMSPEKFLRLNSISAEGKPIQYLLKFANGNIRDDLCDKVEELKQEIAANGKAKETPKATGFKFIDSEEPAKEDDKKEN